MIATLALMLLAACGAPDNSASMTMSSTSSFDHREESARKTEEANARAALLRDFQITGEVSDKDFVAIVTSEYGSDTLTIDAFNGNIDRLKNLFPDVMGDDSQARTVKRGIVDRFILDHVLVGEARKRSIKPDAANVESRLKDAMSQDMNQAAGQSEEELRTSVENELMIQSLMAELLNGGDPPTDAEVAEYRDLLAISVNASHILISVAESDPASAVENARTQVLGLIDSLDAGSEFSGLAMRHSTDPGTAVRGGELGFFGHGNMVKPFEEAAFALTEPGQITREPVRSSFGFHIIKLNERVQKEMTVEEARAGLEAKTKRDNQTASIEALKRKAEVQLNRDHIDFDISG